MYERSWLNMNFYSVKLQSNLSIVDTIGTDPSVLIKEVSLIISEVVLYTTFWVPECVLIIEVSIFLVS